MNGIRLVILACALLALWAATPVHAGVTVEKIDYHGWQNAYRMSNGTIDLVFVPKIGRIMRYGYVNGPNVLWENRDLQGKTPDPSNLGTEWINYGGDKLWNAPQERSGWPPDPELDRGAYTVESLPGGHLRITGTASPKLGLRFQREITLAARGTEVTIRNIMLNGGRQPTNWSTWEVTQIDDPEVVRLPRNREGSFPKGYYLFPDPTPPPAGAITVTDREVEMRRNAERAVKIGSDSAQGWIRGRVAGQQFTVSAAYEAGKVYPDKGCALEIYVNPDPLKYAEMELLSPLHDIAPGKSASFVTRWKLAK